MNIKKTLAGIASYALVGAVAAGIAGSLAYQNDVDADVNTMSLGDVDIVQNEYQRENDKEKETNLVSFKQLKEVKPAHYTETSIPWAPKEQWVVPNDQAWKVVEDNPAVIDKFVTVKNVGSDDAYVRTIIAFEVGKDGVNDPYMHLVINDANNSPWDFKWLKDGEKDLHVEIGDGTFALGVFTYTEALASGKETVPSVKQIYLDKTATNEVVKAYGETFEIFVFSQAVQTDMGDLAPADALDAAFGEISNTNHPWMKKVDSADSLKAALKEGGTVILSKDITLDETIEVKGDVQIVGNGNTITVPANGTRIVNLADTTEDVSILISGAKLDAADKERGISFFNNSGDLTVDVIDSEIVAQHYGINVASGNANAVLNVKNSTITGFCAFQTWSPNTVATFENCTLNGVNKWEAASGDFATVVVNEGADNSVLTFNNCKVTAQALKDAAEYHLMDNSNGATVTWNNCTFVNIDAAGNETVVDAPTVY
ncbi:MAG: hypothetical protein IKL00_02195 [Oscillospiraceae bacterium]|nr:hypothetical protein [Oscillospiraceae bacterium]